MLVLRTPVELHGEDLRTVGEFTIKAGEEIPFVLTYGPSHAPPPKAIDWRRALAQTERFWKQWSGRYRGTGRYADAVRHSLIVLKALTYRPTGGIVAAPTTSLPEKLGGPRNWDYRYCWLRDATFTLLALMDSGYFDEASRWRDWLLRAVAGTPTQVQIMYGIAGERRLTEWDIGWLGGYEGSRPVRVGNAAADQLQLDIYGEVMDVLHVARCGAVGGKEPAWGLQKSLLEHLESIWQKPDSGIWEMRGAPRHFTHSKVMAWVAFDRAVRTAEQFSLEGPTERWRETRDRLKSEICERGFNRDIGAFTQSYGSTELDASLLLLPLVGFLEPSDPRVKSTVAAIERDLMYDGFVRRYRTEKTDDGLSGGEGVFLACSFWLADNFVLLGRREEARRLFERLLSLANDVGLLSEEYDPKSGRLLGNFPQALSHIALINTAQNLMREGTPAEQRSGSKAA